ncbi:hypothetical protein PspLS_08796 [Pyricularia sp. CBS 133598]|nr:hypothetical protein PspLS_08796 [Pyricularia sp. CBS 133598]
MDTQIPIIFIMGPTGVGKTRLSVEIATAVNGEIISLDSMQTYRDCPIMAAQVTEKEMKGIPHHLVNNLEANQELTTAAFVNASLDTICDIYNCGRVPIVCGGSISLTRPLLFHPFVRAQNVLPLALAPDLSTVKNLCDTRIEQMVRDGMLREVQNLARLERRFGLYDDPVRRGAWRTIGYPELRGWYEATQSGDPGAARELERGKELMRRNTLRYAEMQLRLLEQEIIPASAEVYRACIVFNTISRTRFSMDVEQPAIRKCTDWLLKSRWSDDRFQTFEGLVKKS